MATPVLVKVMSPAEMDECRTAGLIIAFELKSKYPRLSDVVEGEGEGEDVVLVDDDGLLLRIDRWEEEEEEEEEAENAATQHEHDVDPMLMITMI